MTTYFVTDFPVTMGGKNVIWITVDRLTKSSHFLPIRKLYGIEHLVEIYIEEIVKLHGVPVSIMSDRDSKFILIFWRAFQKALRMRVHLSTAYHPQTNRQSERMIQTL